MPVLTYEEGAHKYNLDGIEVPSVTTLLKNAGYMKALGFYTKAGSDNGSRRHLLTELYDKNTLDYSTIAIEDMPYLECWIHAKKDLEIVVQPDEIEIKMFHPYLLYAGTADRVSTVAGVRTVIDLKSGAKEKWHELQLILYGLMYAELYEQPLPNLMGVYLKKNGKYNFREYTYENKKYALAAVLAEQWKNK